MIENIRTSVKKLLQYLVIPQLVKYLNLDISVSSIILSSSGDLFESLISVESLNFGYTTWISILVLSVLGTIFYFFQKTLISYIKIFFCKKTKKAKFLKCNINSPTKIKVFLKYYQYFPDNFDKDHSIEFGDRKQIQTLEKLKILDKERADSISYSSTNGSIVFPCEDISINFTDETFGISGTLQYRNDKQTVISHDKDGKKTEVDFFVPRLELNLDTQTFQQMNKFIKYVSKLVSERDSKKVTQYHVKVYTNGKGLENSTIVMNESEGPINWNTRKKKYIDSFFHTQKCELWEQVKKVQFCPEYFTKFGQTGRHIILAYGPPGTGKSTYAYRVAMATGRHVISINLSEFKARRELYQVLTRPYVNELHRRTPKEVVFIFDEFERAIINLNKKQLLKEKYQKAVEKKMDGTNKDDDADDEDEKKIKKKSKHIEDTSDVDIKKVNETVFDDNNITMNDLLNIIQGPVPIEGLMIVATTNHFDQIKDISPALFREGRFEPVYFGNPTPKTMNDMFKFYYNKEIPIDIVLPKRFKKPFSYFTKLMAIKSYDEMLTLLITSSRS